MSGRVAMPDLSFGVVIADVVAFAASPTILFKVRISNANADETVHSIILNTEIRIEASRRHYDAPAGSRLQELFGEPPRWGQTVKSILWTHATTTVPPFQSECIAELPVACTYDFDVAAAKYFHSLDDGDVPLLFLFGGTVFYSREEQRIQAAQIPWEKDARYRMPVRVWKEMMERYYPNSPWLKLRKDIFDRLYQYRVERGLPTWEAAIDRLLRESASGWESE